MKRAILLAGGKGTRLKPYTIAIPKPLVPVGDKPILELIIQKLQQSGFSHITIAINHMADLIKAFFGNGSKWGVHIDYILEDKPLSTMGPLSLINDLPDDFLVMNGDVLTDLDFNVLFEKHIESSSPFTISAFRRIEKIDYGVLEKNTDDQLIGFKEKPSYDFLVSMGVYIVNKSVTKQIPYNTFFGFDHLMHRLIETGVHPVIVEHKGTWLDIGRPDDYEQAIQLVGK